MRHAQLYQWWHDMPDGPARIKAMNWFAEWTAARDPYDGAGQGAGVPGFHSANVDEAYRGYTGLLDAIYHRGRPGPPPRPLAPPDETDAIQGPSGDEEDLPALAETGRADPS